MDADKPLNFLDQKRRVLALLIYIFILLLSSKLITGSFFPGQGGRSLWLLSGIGLWFFVLISAPIFRAPRDSLVNSVAAVLLLCSLSLNEVSLFKKELEIFRWAAVALGIFVVLAAVIAIFLKDTDPVDKPKVFSLSKISYLISDSLGKGEIVFTPIALISILGFYQSNLLQQLWLFFLWVFLVVVKPVDLLFKLVINIQQIKNPTEPLKLIGKIQRVDNPNIIRISLNPDVNWGNEKVFVACFSNSEKVKVFPLFSYVQENGHIATGVCFGKCNDDYGEAVIGSVYESNETVNKEEIIKILGGEGEEPDLIGFVVENSHISNINFEISPNKHLEEGMVVYCKQEDKLVCYQILDAKTDEEMFDKNPHGRQIVAAAQLGYLDEEKGFVKYGWLPKMNTPIFISKKPLQFDLSNPKDDEFSIGKVPGSNITVRVSFSDLLEYHTAILGVTGTGKTELVFDVVRVALKLNTKVFCVDFTGEYIKRLKDQNPESMGLDEENSKGLDKKLFDVDTGEYGAPKEKKALSEFVDGVKPAIEKKVGDFLTSDGPSLGVIELPEITNTKASLRATELYLSSIMNWAKNNRKAKKILIVLEEAHTIIPEIMGSGFDSQTQWVVNRISQIALQGRKYGVGLLIVSQRTALVSKSILSQCNTNITFSLYDKTSLDYLSNIYSADHVKGIPNLRNLEAFIFGKAVRSERPVIMKIDFDEAKKKASEELNVIKLKEKIKVSEELNVTDLK